MPDDQSSEHFDRGNVVVNYGVKYIADHLTFYRTTCPIP